MKLCTCIEVQSKMQEDGNKNKLLKEILREDYKDVLPGLRDAVDVGTASKDYMRISQLRVQRHLMECVMNGNWEEVWRCLQVYYHAKACQHIYDENPRWCEIWQVGSESLGRMSAKTVFEKSVFYREIFNHDRYRRFHVTVEHILFLISKGDIDEALHISKAPSPSLPNFPDKHYVELEQEWQVRKSALCGMLAYLQWLKEPDDEPSMDAGEDYEEDEDEKKSSRRAEHAAEAIKFFETLRDVPGVWDIFITKLDELYQYLNLPQKAEEVYHEYWKLNPQNPNASKYLYNCLKSSGSSPSKCLEVLQDIANKQPSDGLVVDYVELLLESFPESPDSRPSVCLHHLFRLLDYPSSGQNLRAWELFTDLLRNVLDSKDESQLAHVREHWTSRESWWPSQYFSLTKFKLTKSPELQTARALAAGYLIGNDSKFVIKVECWLQKKQNHRLLRKVQQAKRMTALSEPK